MASELNEKIRHFYDASTPLWLGQWGEHMHHGYYGADGHSQKRGREAQVDMIRALLEWGGITGAARILDLGCGVGGSARYLARRFGAEVLGVTLSPVQAQTAARLNRQAGLEDRVTIRVQDMMDLAPAAAGRFDLVWSLESAEHIADKKALLARCRDFLLPGGRLLLATWCRREDGNGINGREQHLLDRVGRAYHLPPLAGIAQYHLWATELGYTGVKTADWSAAVAPFWSEVIRSALTWRGLAGLIRSGAGTWKGALATAYMKRGLQSGLIRFGVMQAQK